MDVQMPEIDGVTATRRIREAEQITGRHVLIVALTTSVANSTRVQCQAVGMDDFLGKPIDFKLLEIALEYYL
jgi:two-component system, sensor histidine kinase and response regulator